MASSLPIYRGPVPMATHQHGGPIERVPVSVFDHASDASRAVAREIVDLVAARAAAGRTTVLGLATGSTPVGVYDELVRLHREEGVSFRTVVTFNLDEYWPMKPESEQSYHSFMSEHLFDHVNILRENIHIPSGLWTAEEVERRCADYERLIAQHGEIGRAHV